MGKKRKSDTDLDQSFSLHQSFVATANSLSQLYTQSMQQHKRGCAEGARHVLEKELGWVYDNFAHLPSVPTAMLLQHLHAELQDAQAQVQAACLGAPSQPCASALPDQHMEDVRQKEMRHFASHTQAAAAFKPLTSADRNLGMDCRAWQGAPFGPCDSPAGCGGE